MLYSWVLTICSNRARVIILIFHDVRDNDILKFKKIISFLYKRFNFITPQQFDEFMAHKVTLRGLNILVSFDDGFVSSKNVTESVLQNYNIKAAFFCCPGFIGLDDESSRRFVSNNIYANKINITDVVEAEYPMQRNDLQLLSNDGHLIASHTLSHKKLSLNMSDEELECELTKSKILLYEMVKKNVTWIAYPFGDINSINAKSLNSIGKYYKYCFSGIRGTINKNSNPMCLPRICVTLQDPYWLQLALIYGGTNLFHYPKRKKINEMTAS